MSKEPIHNDEEANNHKSNENKMYFRKPRMDFV